MTLYSCDRCGNPHEQVHILIAENEVGVITVITMCDECAEDIDFEYEYLMSLTDIEKTDKYGLFH